MNQITLYDNLFNLITPQTTILTPNRRLAATLQKLYQQHALSTGKAVWLTPDILPITSWLQRLWNDFLSTACEPLPLILNVTQEKFLWEKIITDSKRYDSLLRTSETADKACAAYGLLQQWQVPLDDTRGASEIKAMFHSAEDYIALHDWITAFEKLCEEKNWLSLSTLPDKLARHISTDDIILPSSIILVGFTDLSPQLKSFLNACNQAGSPHQEFTLTANESKTVRIGLADAELEIRTMAQWAKQLNTLNPASRIGCVIPKIETMRDRVQQIFTETFALENQLQGSTDSFNITAGKPLQQYPIIHAALTLLSLYKKTTSLELLSQLLFTPFMGEAESERLKRAKFDRSLRQANISRLNLRVLCDEKNESRLQLNLHCPHLAKRLRQLFTFLNDIDKHHSYQQWAKLFTKMLTILGWPGERSLNSEEFQVVDSWLNLLDNYISLDVISEPISFHKAFQALQKVCASTVFQPKTPDAPIQVMGLLEAASIPFDYLWVGGMDDLSWPPQPQPNPFIPKRLQRELQMPHATAERELLFCKTLMQQFSHCTQTLIYSFAEKNDELELQPSALIRDFESTSMSSLNIPEQLLASEKIFHSKNLEWLQDDMAPPLGEGDAIRGGINVIQHQALCPFRSFARWRLHAQELETPVPGLRAKDRGTIIHKIMEIIWNQLQDHQGLIAIDEEKLLALIKSTVHTALLASPPSHSDSKQYLALEKQRLEKLIYEWLENEKMRDPFKVLTHEKRVEFSFGKLNLAFRIDRIDLLEDGKQFIVDYKTGKYNDLNAWFSDRPEQPQLPLYALIEPTETVGIAFAQICAGEHCFKGVSRYAMELKGVKLISEVKSATSLSWDQQITQWETVLSKLSADFSLGIAHVDPKEAEQTCQWCALKPLCRISEEICN